MSAPTSAVSGAGRLAFIDALRGFALFGVFWANLPIFAGLAYMNDEQRTAVFASPLDGFAQFFELFFIENKFMGLFSTLFGISFWLFLSRVTSRGVSATPLFYRRIVWLFAIGLAHGWLLWSFDILRFYALWAVLLPLVVRTPPGRLLAMAVGCAVMAPALVAGAQVWTSVPADAPVDCDALALAAFTTGRYRDVLAANWAYDWYQTLSVGQIAYQVAVFGRLLLGLYIARTLDLGRLEAHGPLLRRVLLAGAVVGTIGNSVFAWNLLSGPAATPALAVVRRFVVESGHLGFTLAYASGLALAFQVPRWRRVLGWLAPVGRMALTWYLFQTLLGIWLFYGFARGPALMGQVAPAALVGICLLGFVAQALVARVWLTRFRFGPAEWLWRTLTYWNVQPFAAAVGDPTTSR